MIHLKVSEDEAQIALRRVQHQVFLDGVRLHWKVDDCGVIDGRSICWLYCWAKTGMNSQDAKMAARRIFNEICDVSFEKFDAKVSHQWARDARYSRDPRSVEAELSKLFG